MARTSAPVTSRSLPPISKTSPRYAELQQRRRQLVESAEALRAERVRLAQASRYDHLDRPEPSNVAEVERRKRIATLIGDVISVPTPRTEPLAPTIAEQLAGVVQRLEDTEIAHCELMAPIDQAKRDASRTICVHLTDEYRAHVTDVAGSILALHGKVLALLEFYRAIERAGYSAAPLQPIAAGDLIGQPRCPLRAFLLQARAAGLPVNLPVDWR